MYGLRNLAVTMISNTKTQSLTKPECPQRVTCCAQNSSEPHPSPIDSRPLISTWQNSRLESGSASQCSHPCPEFSSTSSLSHQVLVETGSASQTPAGFLSLLPSTHGVDGRVGVDLQCVDVICGVLEEPIIRIQHFMTQQIQPLPANKDSTVHVYPFPTFSKAVNVCHMDPCRAQGGQVLGTKSGPLQEQSVLNC